MTTKMRTLRNFRNPIGCLILLAALGAASGCSTAENPGGSATNMNHVLPSGSSVEGWMVVPSGGSHASIATQDYIANGGASGCTECHGPDLSGGISGTSCFGNPAGCHHDPVANWAAPSRGDTGRPPRRPRAAPGSPPARSATGATSPAAGRRHLLLLPRGERAAPPATVARPPVHPHRHGHVERAGLRAVPLPGVAEQPGEPSGHPRPGGDGAGMLQQHAVPRRRTRLRTRWALQRPGPLHDDLLHVPAVRELPHLP